MGNLRKMIESFVGDTTKISEKYGNFEEFGKMQPEVFKNPVSQESRNPQGTVSIGKHIIFSID